jgi:hypothetical protein
VHGVYEGDDYTLIPFNSREEIKTGATIVMPINSKRHDHTQVLVNQREQTNTTKAQVAKVNGFTATILGITQSNFPATMALALPLRRHHPWLVSFPAHLQYIWKQLDESVFFRHCESGEEPLLEFR